MKVFDFRNFLFEKGFSFTNEGKTQFFHKNEAKNKIFINGDKIEVKGEIFDIPENEKNAEVILKLSIGEIQAKKEEKTENSAEI